MKTKIIYISGNEVFDMADIRAAFEEVRTALSLDNDTVLFGVPVDADDALATNATQNEIVNDTTTENAAPQEQIPRRLNDAPVAPQAKTSVKKSRGRPTKTEKQDVAINDPKTSDASPVITTSDNTGIANAEHDAGNVAVDNDKVVKKTDDNKNTAAEKSDGKIIPILSILAAKQDAPTVSAATADTAPAKSDYAETDIAEPEPIINDTDAETEIISNNDEIQSQPVSIDDMISDDAPVAQHEKTLEELLESMTPLREDHTEEETTPDATDNDEIRDFDNIVPDDTDDATDATLAQLATEFAQTEDKIITTPKNSPHGKIGKLKNILPFKKAKRDDTGLMGDLFGWAGIAANDEDFSMPGFFTGAAVKK